jgi:hypothetical protein
MSQGNVHDLLSRYIVMSSHKSHVEELHENTLFQATSLSIFSKRKFLFDNLYLIFQTSQLFVMIRTYFYEVSRNYFI